MRSIPWVVIAAAAVAICASAHADVFPTESLIKRERKDVAGGRGTLYAEYAFTRDQALKDQAIKE